jgi:polyhydroxybutyrate depolymerase
MARLAEVACTLLGFAALAALGCEQDGAVGTASQPFFQAGSGGAAPLGPAGAAGAPAPLAGSPAVQPQSDAATPSMPGADASGVQPPDAGAAGAGGDAATDAGGTDVPITCPTMRLMPGDHEQSLDHGGRRRTYLVHVPSSYTGTTPVPAVFDFHGYGSSGRGQMGASGFREAGEQHGFVGVYPDGVGGSWHVNGCCGQAAQEQLDEIAFVRAIFAQLTQSVCIDPRRVYASGVSQGGGMAHHVACLAADLFAAVAPVSSDLRTDPCMPARPISQLSARGLADTLSAYEGGQVGPPGMAYTSIGARATFERWRAIDECTGEPAAQGEHCESYTECAGGVEVTLCSIPGGGHVLYQNSAGFEVAETAWAMFERQALPD